MFEELDTSARHALFGARHLAAVTGSPHIRPEHALWGVLGEQGLAAREACARCGASVPELLADVEAWAVRDARPAVPSRTPPEIPFDDSSKRVMHHSLAAKRALEHARVAGEHLLLGLLQEADAPVAALLARHGVTLFVAREHVVAIREGRSTDQESLVHGSMATAAARSGLHVDLRRSRWLSFLYLGLGGAAAVSHTEVVRMLAANTWAAAERSARPLHLGFVVVNASLACRSLEAATLLSVLVLSGFVWRREARPAHVALASTLLCVLAVLLGHVLLNAPPGRPPR